MSEGFFTPEKVNVKAMKEMDKVRERSKHRTKDDKEEDDSNARVSEKNELWNSEEKGRSRKGENVKERGDRDGSWKEETNRDIRDKQRHRERGHRENRRSEKQRETEYDGDYREKEREREKHREGKEKEKKERHRDDRERDGDKVRDREKEESREREKLKEKERKRRDSERGKERERRESDKDRDRDWKEIDEERERKKRRREDDAVRSGEKTRERERQRDKEVDRSRDKNRDEEDDREREKKRRRKDEESGKADVKAKRDGEEDDFDEEQKKLDEEMEKRRRRVQEWQELRRRKEEDDRKKRVEAGESMDQSANTGKAWTLEGESDDEDIPPKADDAKSKGNSSSRVSAFENGDVVTMDIEEEIAKDVKRDHAKKHEDTSSGYAGKNVEGEEVDPLDAFMNSMVLPEVEKLTNEDALRAENDKVTKPEDAKTIANGKQVRKAAKLTTGRIIQGEDSASEEEGDYRDEDNMEEDDDEFMKRVKKSKAEKLAVVDHSKIQYAPFRKNFYIEVKEVSRMSVEEASAYRKQLELKIRGKDVPRPVKTWNQTGLSTKGLDVIKKSGFEKPMPIQAQALPIIMSGRDCIGIAKTGSGKTLAFVLPMLRHIMDQPPLSPGDGPIGLIMAPTRELVQQIYSDIKKFTKVMGLGCVPVYGGSGVAQQISDLKRGTEIVVCTPGRMIDILCTSAGKISNLRRVTYLVLDEADRMFDMGFEPQITRIIQNTRPDRQTVLFSATFPRQVEVLARKVLNKPVEIQVGGRSVVNKDITQTIEVRVENERFLRLLELLGEWYEKGKILVFVHSQEKCDSLFKDLLKRGYPCLSLHGGKDQTDRESTLSDFKSNVCNLLIATSVAARGLDVKELELVVNYDVPNHYEEYVHRVGRTGRAGRKGVAITFISEDESRYAPDLVKALELSEQLIPDDLKKLADDFMAKVNQGTEQVHASGYGGSGFKFNEEEEEVRKAAKKAQAKEFGFEEEEDKSDSDSDNEGIRKAGGDLAQAAAAAALAVATKAGLSVPVSGSLPLTGGQPALGAGAGKGVPGVTLSLPGMGLPGIQLANMGGLTNMASIPGSTGIAGISTLPGLGLPGFGLTPGMTPTMPNEGAARAAALAAALNLQHNLAKIQADAIPEHYEAELEINDFPQHARWKVTHKDSLGPISEWTGAAITTRGQYFPPGKVPAPGERKLFLFIEGPTEASVKKAKTEIKRILEESTAASISLPSGVQPGKYSVL